MKNDRKHVYVVEGNTDEDKLKKLGVTFIVKTGGKFIRPEIIEFLKEIYQKRNIVLLTDPDGPGRLIAQTIESRIGKCIILKAEKQKAIYHDKVGIAEMKLSDIAILIKEQLEFDNQVKEDSLSLNDLFDLGLIGPSSKGKKDILIEKYHLPFTTGKNVLNALNMLCLTKDEIKEDIQQ